MIADISAKQLTVTIGGIDYSSGLLDLDMSQDSLNESGIISTKATLTFYDTEGLPGSLDPRINPATWFLGQQVNISLSGNQLATLFITRLPRLPENGQLVVDAGCWLTWANWLNLEADFSQVNPGDSVNSATVVTRILEAAGIPLANLNLGTWDYNLNYPLNKLGLGSLVNQAGQLAWANDCRLLYSDPQGVIQSTQWSTPATPVTSVTIGQDEALFLPVTDPVNPVESLVVSGTGYANYLIPDFYSTSTSSTEPASNYSDSAAGLVTLSTTVTYSYSLTNLTRTTKVTEQLPQIAAYVVSDSVLSTNITTTTVETYDMTTELLSQVQVTERGSVRVIAGPDSGLSGQVILSQSTTDYTYDTDEILIRQVVTETLPAIQVDPETTGSQTTQVTVRQEITEWTEERPDYWVRTKTGKVASRFSPDRRGGTIKPTALVTSKPVVDPGSQPPSSQRWPNPNQLQEQVYQATVTWDKSSGLNRTRPYTINPAFSNQNCFNVATKQLEILEGRSESYQIHLPITLATQWIPPLSTIQVSDSDYDYVFTVDACTWIYETNTAYLGLIGILRSRTSISLPDFESGITPGQSPDPEPPVIPQPPVSALASPDGLIDLASPDGTLVIIPNP